MVEEWSFSNFNKFSLFLTFILSEYKLLKMSSSGDIDAAHPVYGPFFGVMGAASAIVLSGKKTLSKMVAF